MGLVLVSSIAQRSREVLMVWIGMMFKKKVKRPLLIHERVAYVLYKNINDAYAQVVRHSFSWHFLLGYRPSFDIGVGIE